MSRKPNNTRRLGLLLDLEVAGLETRLPTLISERLAAEADPVFPDLIRVEPARAFEVRSPASADGSRVVLFSIDRPEPNPPCASWIPVSQDEALRARIKEGLRWWANEILWISEVADRIDLPPQTYPNIRRWVTRDGLHVVDISHYRLKVAERLFAQWPEGIGFLPFLFEVWPPPPAEAAVAAEKWRAQVQTDFERVCAEAARKDPQRPFALMSSIYYRSYLMPGTRVIETFVTENDVEQGARRYGGPCFVVNLLTGSYASRWADR